MSGACSQQSWANARSSVKNPPDASTFDLVPCFLGSVLHFVHGKDSRLTEITTPGGKQQPPVAGLLASDGQACLGCELWVVSGQGFAVWSLSRGWECCHRPMSQHLLLSALSVLTGGHWAHLVLLGKSHGRKQCPPGQAALLIS